MQTSANLTMLKQKAPDKHSEVTPRTCTTTAVGLCLLLEPHDGYLCIDFHAVTSQSARSQLLLQKNLCLDQSIGLCTHKVTKAKGPVMHLSIFILFD